MPRKPPKSPTERPSAYGKALGLLARREHSQRELEIKLSRGGYERDETAIAIASLNDSEYQSDSRFAELLARSRAGNGYGQRRIVAELKSHGVADADIAAAIAAADCDWRDLARRQLELHYGRKPESDPKQRARRAAFLLRRGFDAATVSALTRADCGDPDDGFD